jgi:uncharacterized membrane protein YdjX (TVP38/TMEM64 family)
MAHQVLKRWKWVLAVVVVGMLAFVLLQVQGNGYFDPMVLREFIAGYGIYAPVVYVVVYAVATMFAIPGAALTLTGGALFGPLVGTAATVVGASIGATGSFLIVRVFRRGTVQVESPTSRWRQVLAQYDARLAHSGFVTVLLLRLMPLVPFNALNYALGFTSVRTRVYVLATVLGIIPGTFAFTYFGDAVTMLMPFHIIGALGVLGILLLLGKFIQRHYGYREA